MSDRTRVVVIIELLLMPLLLTLLFITVLVDVWKHKIPNINLILLAILQAISEIYSISTKGSNFSIKYFGLHCLTIFLIFIFLYIFFSIGGIGAGDVKLIVLTAFGNDRPVTYLGTVLMIALAMSLVRMIRHHNFCSRLNKLVIYLNQLFEAGQLIPYSEGNKPPSEKERYSVHLSIPVFLACCIVVVQRLGN